MSVHNNELHIVIEILLFIIKMYSQITFPAPLRERGPRKFLCVYVFMELFAWKLLIAVMACHAFFDGTYHVTTNIRFVGPLSLCAAYLNAKKQEI